MMWIVLFISAFLAGAIQTVTGFGAGVLLILVLSNFYGLVIAPALNTSICLGITAVLTWRHRKKLDLKLILFPVIIYCIVSVSTIYSVEKIDLGMRSLCFGIFLITLGGYFLLFADHIHLKGSPCAGGICAAISGLFSGLFGVGGPVMGLYLITVTSDHETYLANIQFLFTITNIINLTARCICGIYVLDLLPVSILGIVAVNLGSLGGRWLCQKLNIEILKKIIYLFVCISGIVTLIQSLL